MRVNWALAIRQALLGAVKTWSSFAGRSSVRSWLTGILRNKIVDSIRRRKPYHSWHGGAAAGDYTEFDHLFTADDAWHPAFDIERVKLDAVALRN